MHCLVSLLVVLQLLTCSHDVDGSLAVGRTGRIARRLSWSDWSVGDFVPGHARHRDSLKIQSEDEYYRKGIIFELYTRENPDEYEQMDIYTSDKTTSKHFNPLRPTKILTHGWMTNGVGVKQLKQAFLKTMDVNVIIVNWEHTDSVFYPLVRWHVPKIGQRVAYLMDFLRLVYTVPDSALHLVGHSLGAHISGLAGRLLQWGTVARITGLDPAGPMFPTDRQERLDKSDAAFVDVIHTCANVLGFKDPIGHVDFFPNGGTCIQPGCSYLSTGTCGHNRAFDLMEESILKEDSFKAYPCSGMKGQPDYNQPPIIMGLAVPLNATGTYCLKTRGSSPFSIDQGPDSAEHSVSSSGSFSAKEPDNELGPDSAEHSVSSSGSFSAKEPDNELGPDSAEHSVSSSGSFSAKEPDNELRQSFDSSAGEHANIRISSSIFRQFLRRGVGKRENVELNSFRVLTV